MLIKFCCCCCWNCILCCCINCCCLICSSFNFCCWSNCCLLICSSWIFCCSCNCCCLSFSCWICCCNNNCSSCNFFWSNNCCCSCAFNCSCFNVICCCVSKFCSSIFSCLFGTSWISSSSSSSSFPSTFLFPYWSIVTTFILAYLGGNTDEYLISPELLWLFLLLFCSFWFSSSSLSSLSSSLFPSYMALFCFMSKLISVWTRGSLLIPSFWAFCFNSIILGANCFINFPLERNLLTSSPSANSIGSKLITCCSFVSLIEAIFCSYIGGNFSSYWILLSFWRGNWISCSPLFWYL